MVKTKNDRVIKCFINTTAYKHMNPTMENDYGFKKTFVESK